MYESAFNNHHQRQDCRIILYNVLPESFHKGFSFIQRRLKEKVLYPLYAFLNPSDFNIPLGKHSIMRYYKEYATGE